MFAKCAALVIAVGGCGCMLLALRQQRLQVASELAHTQLRIAAADERLWALRNQISESVSPGNVEQMASGLGTLRPIGDDAGLVDGGPNPRPRKLAQSPLPVEDEPPPAPRKPPARRDTQGKSAPRVAQRTSPR